MTKKYSWQQKSLAKPVTVFVMNNHLSEHRVADDEDTIFYYSIYEAMANDRLAIDGYLLLNDVYKMLHVPRTSQGALIGWCKYATVGEPKVSFVVEMGPLDIDGAHQFSVEITTQGNVFQLIDKCNKEK